VSPTLSDPDCASSHPCHETLESRFQPKHPLLLQQEHAPHNIDKQQAISKSVAAEFGVVTTVNVAT